MQYIVLHSSERLINIQHYPKCFISVLNMFLLFQLRAQLRKLLHHKNVLYAGFFLQSLCSQKGY